MSEWFNPIVTWLAEHESLVAWITLGSAGFFFLTLLLIPWLIVRIPADYFINPGRYRSALFGEHPIAIAFSKLIRNAIALCLIIIGLLLFVLPGQGILTVVVGVAVADFPGKHRLVNWLVSKNQVIRPINWLRRKAKKEELQLKPPIDP